MSASRHKKSFAKAILMFTYCPLLRECRTESALPRARRRHPYLPNSVIARLGGWARLLRSCEQVEEPSQTRIPHCSLCRDRIEPIVGQWQRSFHTQDSKTPPMHCDEPSRQGGNEVGLGNDR